MLLLRACGPWLLRGLSARWKVEELDTPAAQADSAALICLWHGRMLVGMRHYSPRKWVVLVSASEDGDVSERLLQALGFRVIRGSSSRGGARALRSMLEALGAGQRVIVTPDGPRGPRHVPNQGLAWMARATGYPILPLGMSCDRAWRLGSWDRFTIPKPGARIVYTWGAPIHVERHAGPRELEAATRLVRERLMEAERRGFERLHAEPDW